VPDGREIVGGQGVFAVVAGRLAADVGRIGDADEGEGRSATEAQSHREVRRGKTKNEKRKTKNEKRKTRETPFEKSVARRNRNSEDGYLKVAATIAGKLKD
jgi:hypothetical protein